MDVRSTTQRIHGNLETVISWQISHRPDQNGAGPRKLLVFWSGFAEASRVEFTGTDDFDTVHHAHQEHRPRLGHHPDAIGQCGGWADKIQGRTIATWGGPAHDYVHYEPYGVVGAIIPWNGPLFAATMVMAPALAAGNCIVVKSPDLAPYSVMKLVELMREAGFPPGVVNLVTGGADVGAAMVAHPGIDKIQFVGSGATAKQVLASAARTLKPCGLELGGKSAVIVFGDADLQNAAKKGLSGAVSANGQGCVNGTRLLVERATTSPDGHS